MGNTEERKKQEAGHTAHIWCTSCGRILPEDSVYCEFCGSRVEHEMERSPDDGRGRSEGQNTEPHKRIEYQDEKGGFCCLKHLGWKKAAAAGVIAACGLVLSVVWASARQVGRDVQPVCGYIKDNSLFVLKGNKTSVELSESCLRDWKNREQLRLPAAAGWLPSCSGKKEILWYPEQTGDGAFSLMSFYNKKEQKADGGVISAQTAGDTAVYEKSNNGLYVYAKGKKQKLTAGVSSYQLRTDGAYLIWQEQHPDQTVGLYGAALDKKGKAAEKELLERDAELLGASEDLKSVLYQKEGEIWLLENHSERRRLAQNVNQVFLADADAKTLFFTRQENGGESLYYLDGMRAGKRGAEQLLDPEFLFLIHGEDGIVVYKASGEGGEEIRIAGAGMSAALDCDPDQELSFTVSGGYGWYLAPPEAGAEQALYRVSLNQEEFGSTEEAAQDADRFCGQYRGMPFYLNDVHEQTGDLYFGEESVSYDVKTESVCPAQNQKGEETGIYFLSDYDQQTGSGVLTEYSGEDRRLRRMDSRVSGYLTAPWGILYFTDYDQARGRGTLNYYQKGTSRKVDEDVWAAYIRNGDTAALVRQNQVYAPE